MKDITKEYSNGEVTVVWKPKVCIHSEKCFKGLPEVFDPNKKPWINAEGADTDTIKAQINKCPSGALSYYMNDNKDEVEETRKTESIIETIENGPLMVYWNLTVKHHNGEETKKSKVTAFCICGASGNKPYCDGTHAKINFKG